MKSVWKSVKKKRKDVKYKRLTEVESKNNLNKRYDENELAKLVEEDYSMSKSEDSPSGKNSKSINLLVFQNRK